MLREKAITKRLSAKKLLAKANLHPRWPVVNPSLMESLHSKSKNNNQLKFARRQKLFQSNHEAIQYRKKAAQEKLKLFAFVKSNNSIRQLRLMMAGSHIVQQLL